MVNHSNNNSMLFFLFLLAFINHIIRKTFAYSIDEELSMEARCYGIDIDFDRLRTVSIKDVDWLMNPVEEEEQRSFSPSQIEVVTDSDNNRSSIRGDRVRLQEAIGQINIYGAETVVMLDSCEEDHACVSSIQSLSGKTYENIHVSGGYIPTYDEHQAKLALANFFMIPVSDVVGDLSLMVYPTKEGDFLSYIGQVFVNDVGHPQLYDVVIDAHTLTILQRCNRLYTGPKNKGIRARKRRILDAFQTFDTAEVSTTKGLRANQQQQRSKLEQQQQQQQHQLQLQKVRELNVIERQRNGISCESCASYIEGITWSNTLVECPINSLYLNNTGRTTTCVRDANNLYSGPGPVPDLHWGGTYDCNSTTDNCNMVPLPDDCPDAANDAQYAGIQTLQYFREYLGVMGGLSMDESNPKPVEAYVHYDTHYCNAFFRAGKDAVYFGDCDCSFRTPLPTVDIVAHEITHGVTLYSSRLLTSYQAGGLNEAFSDIVATAVEVLVDDSWDTPDFHFGEMLYSTGSIRSMEDPFGGYLKSACDYNSDVDSHHASGPVDLAYVTAVRACASTNYCGSLKECILLMSSSFMYANIHGLTSLSGYLDAAEATCSLADEFLSAHPLPQLSSCENDPKKVRQFIKDGWCMVNVAINSNCEASYACGGQEGNNTTCSSFGDGTVPDDSVPWLYRVVSETIPNWFRTTREYLDDDDTED